MTGAATASAGPRYGTSANGMEYVALGSGPRTLLFLQGGPGSEVSRGLTLRMARRLFRRYLDAGFTVWVVTRRRNMPPGHTVADMADDYALTIDGLLGGRVDLVVGESYGGMVAQHLAGGHPGCLDLLALVVTGAELSTWAKEVDSRMAEALTRGDVRGASRAAAVGLLPAPLAWLRAPVAPMFTRRLFRSHPFAVQDALVEIEAEMTYDSRTALPRIRVPVLMISSDRDRFFPKPVVEETAALIPDCEVRWYPGRGHVGVASSTRVPRDVMEFVARH